MYLTAYVFLTFLKNLKRRRADEDEKSVETVERVRGTLFTFRPAVNQVFPTLTIKSSMISE